MNIVDGWTAAVLGIVFAASKCFIAKIKNNVYIIFAVVVMSFSNKKQNIIIVLKHVIIFYFS